MLEGMGNPGQEGSTRPRSLATVLAFFSLLLASWASCSSSPLPLVERADGNPLPAVMPFSMRYLGTACFIIQYLDRTVCFDPGDFLTHRLSEAEARSLPHCDLILVSHADFDHCNRLAAVPKKPGCVVMGTESLRRAFPGLAIDTSGRYEAEGITIEALPTRHALRSGLEHVAFSISMGGKTLLFMGDSHELAENFPQEPDLLLITIGGLSATPGSAASVARSLGARHVVPMHWERLFRDDSRVRRLSHLLCNGPPLIVFSPTCMDRR